MGFTRTKMWCILSTSRIKIWCNGVVRVGELEKVINELLGKTDENKDIMNKQVRFSVSFSNFDNKRIEYICKRVSTSKQEFISRLVLASIVDIEERLGLVSELETSPIGEEIRKFSDEYTQILFKELGLGNSSLNLGGEEDNQ